MPTGRVNHSEMRKPVWERLMGGRLMACSFLASGGVLFVIVLAGMAGAQGVFKNIAAHHNQHHHKGNADVKVEPGLPQFSRINRWMRMPICTPMPAVAAITMPSLMSTWPKR